MTKSVQLPVRVTEEEKKRLKKLAKTAGFKGNITAYVRERIGLPPAQRGRPRKPKD